MIFRSVVFDWSGTLCDDLGAVYEASMSVLEALGRPRMSLQRYRWEFDLPYMKFYRRLGVRAPQAKIDAHFRLALDEAPRPRLFRGIRPVLESLGRSRVRMALMTTALPDKVAADVDRLRLRQFFVAVRSGVVDKTREFGDFLQETGFDPEATLSVGDMTHDIEAGRTAGVHTAAVTWGYQPRERLERSRPGSIVEKPADIGGLVLTGPGFQG